MYVLVVSLTHPRNAQSKVAEVAGQNPDVRKNAPAPTKSERGIAPFIVRDTQNDSPGTNFVTRIVTFTAEVGGTPPLALQWQVDKGGGFEVIPGATNSSYRIGNAQLVHNGFYALFATNFAGSLHTAPQQLIVTEGED